MFQKKKVEKIKKLILYSMIFFQKFCHLWDNAEKYNRARLAPNGYMALAYGVLDTLG